MKRVQPRTARGERGMSMIELMIAITILAIGMAGTMIMISGAIASNNRNKMDTTATTLAQFMMEQIAAKGASASTTFTLTDCAGNSFTIDPTGDTSSSGRGAGVATSGLNAGGIDFGTTPNPTTYSINYVSCRANGNTSTYNIRWNVKILQPATGTPTSINLKRITVAARQVGAGNGGRNQLQFFAIPVSLTTVVGN